MDSLFDDYYENPAKLLLDRLEGSSLKRASFTWKREERVSEKVHAGQGGVFSHKGFNRTKAETFSCSLRGSIIKSAESPFHQTDFFPHRYTPPYNQKNDSIVG